MPKVRIRHMKMKDEPALRILLFRRSLNILNVKVRLNSQIINYDIHVTPKSYRGFLTSSIHTISYLESGNLNMPSFLHKYLGDIYKATNGLQVGDSKTIEVNKKRIPFNEEGPVSYNRR